MDPADDALLDPLSKYHDPGKGSSLDAAPRARTADPLAADVRAKSTAALPASPAGATRISLCAHTAPDVASRSNANVNTFVMERLRESTSFRVSHHGTAIKSRDCGLRSCASRLRQQDCCGGERLASVAKVIVGLVQPVF